MKFRWLEAERQSKYNNSLCSMDNLISKLSTQREMVSLIPRVSSFAVSGTPARSTVDDLIHVLK